MLNRLKLEMMEDIFDRYLAFWHTDPEIFDGLDSVINPIALELAYRNYLLWHEEDKARRTDVDDSAIATVKRAIDKLNQQRNDQIEKLDEAILIEIERITPVTPAEKINSETPGSIIDRISIMSLKVYHMDEDRHRSDIGEEHRLRSMSRLAVLKLQRFDLCRALEELLTDYVSGNKTMKLYKQFKMYNDPTLNPELYKTRPQK
jgi:hypothetical protein